tara:strand:- start:231 stop:542 length:312 start_codon:yes stop_codon:yes gene_type:complete
MTVRSENVKRFMSHAEDCKKPSQLEYQTNGGDWVIAASEYIVELDERIKEFEDHIVKLENGVTFLCEFIETAELAPINKDWDVPGVVRYGLGLLKKPTQEQQQ